jgi:cytochrome c biogenesis protein CcmG/thiol:disulfide interchange protein DsbE
MLRKSIFFLPILTFFVVGGYFYWGLDPNRNPASIPSVMIDKDVPVFDLPRLEGSGVVGFGSDDLRQGTVTLVNAFSSWCLPCLAEHPVLTELAKRNGIRLYGINYKDKPEDAAAWLREHGNPYARIGADISGRVAIDWGVYGVPETYVVDGNGRIRYRHIGPLDLAAMNEIILPLISELKP